MLNITPFRLLRAILLGISLALFTQIFLVSPARISGTSMVPTLSDRELVILLKIPHVFNLCPAYGDIVAIDSRVKRKRSMLDDIVEPLQNGYAKFSNSAPSRNIWIKRVIGLPGDTLVIRNSELYRNGKKVDEPYIEEPMRTEIPHRYTVPEGTVFVMGDNRNHSVDSREIGPIPLDHILGTALPDTFVKNNHLCNPV